MGKSIYDYNDTLYMYEGQALKCLNPNSFLQFRRWPDVRLVRIFLFQ